MNYALVTPAKNEEAFIEKALKSVVAQTVLPLRWVIVNDGSTDRTSEIVTSYQQRFPFIRLVNRESGQHCFGSKVNAFRAGYAELEDVSFDFIGNLDADIELPCDYYERLLAGFADDAKLGLSGGTRYDLCNGEFVKIRFSEFSIGGAYQLFRRECFDAIGGYLPLEMGGEDLMACVMARQFGWRVCTREDILVHHYRSTGTAQGSQMRLGFRTGKKNFLLGYHPVFECIKLMRITRVGDLRDHLSEFAGFVVAAMQGGTRQVPNETVKFLRTEQLDRLKQTVLRFRDPASGDRTRRHALPSSKRVEG
ncbi:glycosyltransferase [Neorhodopirellula pilleata]|uniref:Hyaluronan synthase n=1 Tax=Neorhodopirellula pilleata TaxID=2714738 RepID=A0A5C6A1C8_9BACT|nr:glycosyltransferase family A protein [Neorhodopirellula pilleata]TWT93634.1 Hyaluronan synthase [Neorhodopirellula pilleata]